MEYSIRKPRVSGRFYPFEAEDIRDLMSQFLEKEKDRINYSLSQKRILGAILPHAGHIYSGYQTIHFFEILKVSKQVFDTWIIIHPLHHGGEQQYAAEGSQFWNTPLGDVKVDTEIIESMGIPVSREMHRDEHSSEVILPFIQNYSDNDFTFVSIGISNQNLVTSHDISARLTNAIRLSKKKICVIASSDFSHYVNPELGKAMDQKVVNCIQKKDFESIYKNIVDYNLSICGYGPIMVLCETLNKLNPETESVVLARGHSGEIHPSSSVVDYISFLFYL